MSLQLQQAIQLLESLPAHLQTEVVHFVEFLAQKQAATPDTPADPAPDPEGMSLAERRKANFGRLKGKIIIQPDFDDPIEGFEEYMP